LFRFAFAPTLPVLLVIPTAATSAIAFDSVTAVIPLLFATPASTSSTPSSATFPPWLRLFAALFRIVPTWLGLIPVLLRAIATWSALFAGLFRVFPARLGLLAALFGALTAGPRLLPLVAVWRTLAVPALRSLLVPAFAILTLRPTTPSLLRFPFTFPRRLRPRNRLWNFWSGWRGGRDRLRLVQWRQA
jgi:hypothetical protein